MYYHITSKRDIMRILKKHPKINKESLAHLVFLAIKIYGVNGAISVSEDNSIKYCSLGYYKQNELEYGTQGSFTKEIKYNKYMLKGTK